MREFPKSTTLSPNNKSAVMSNAMPLANGYEPLGEELQSGVSVFHDYGHMIQENNLDVFLSHLEFQTYHQQTQHFQVPDEDAISWSGLDTLFLDRRVLEQRASEIREKLKYAAATENQPHVPSKELLDAIEWIKADNIVANIELYFRHWHKHAPMVHEGTLNPCTAALPLVLVLMSIGGMVRTILPPLNVSNAGLPSDSLPLVLERRRRCYKDQDPLGHNRTVHILRSRDKR
jgi:hypothetical protein